MHSHYHSCACAPLTPPPQIHFKPLWAKNSPHFGIAHALCLGLAPWLAAEVPYLVETGVVKAKS